jgi:hypothetical protein
MVVACNRSGKKEITPIDRVDTQRIEPIHFLHKTFPVKKYVPFEFEVPPHCAIPRVHGNFKSFVHRAGGGDVSNSSANVDFILMNPGQYQDFVTSNGGGTALHSVEGTHDHEVEFLLSPTKDEPQKYYIVFNNVAGKASKYVKADFTLSFGTSD